MKSNKKLMTPWGAITSSSQIARGITVFSTATLGGIFLSRDRMLKMPASIRDGQWYDEDCSYSKVVCAFPTYFSDGQLVTAKAILKQYFPDNYEELYTETVLEGESPVRDKEIFLARNKSKWIVTSAMADSDGMVKCWAALGGRMASEERIFAIPVEEYEKKGPFGFVINPERHLDYDVWVRRREGNCLEHKNFVRIISKKLSLSVRHGNFAQALSYGKALLVAQLKSVQWWAVQAQGSDVDAILLAKEWNPQLGLVRISLPPETPVVYPGDDVFYDGEDGVPVDSRYEGPFIFDNRGVKTIYLSKFDREERTRIFVAAKHDLESGAFCLRFESRRAEDTDQFSFIPPDTYITLQRGA